MDSRSVSAFEALLAALPPVDAPDLRVQESQPATVVAVMARRDFKTITAQRLDLLRSMTPPVRMLLTGPGMWLLFAEEGADAPLRRLETDLADIAHVFDQSSGFGFLQLRGNDARRLLQKAVFVDLETVLVTDGDNLSSVAGHVNVIVWRIAENAYGIAVPRSYAGSFWHWMLVSARAEKITLGR